MRKYTIKGKEHVVYECGDVVPSSIVYREDWGAARVGDWVKADDGCIIQILRRNKMLNFTTVGTCTGTYRDKMDTVRRKNIYNLSGKWSRDTAKTRTVCSTNERMFAKRVIQVQGFP